MSPIASGTEAMNTQNVRFHASLHFSAVKCEAKVECSSREREMRAYWTLSKEWRGVKSPKRCRFLKSEPKPELEA